MQYNMTHMECIVSAFPRRYDTLMNMHHSVILGRANPTHMQLTSITTWTASMHGDCKSSLSLGLETHGRNDQI